MHTSAMHTSATLLHVRCAQKLRGSQKEARSAALWHSDHCFFQSLHYGAHRCPSWILSALASHCQSPVHSSRTCIRPWRPGLGLPESTARRKCLFFRSARQKSWPLRNFPWVTLFLEKRCCFIRKIPYWNSPELILDGARRSGGFLRRGVSVEQGRLGCSRERL